MDGHDGAEPACDNVSEEKCRKSLEGLPATLTVGAEWSMKSEHSSRLAQQWGVRVAQRSDCRASGRPGGGSLWGFPPWSPVAVRDDRVAPWGSGAAGGSPVIQRGEDKTWRQVHSNKGRAGPRNTVRAGSWFL